MKSIVREIVAAQRVFIRDTQSYCGVLLDDNNRKPLCRLYFNSSQMYLGTFDKDKKITKHPVDDVNDIFKFADHLIITAKQHDDQKSAQPQDDTT